MVGKLDAPGPAQGGGDFRGRCRNAAALACNSGNCELVRSRLSERRCEEACWLGRASQGAGLQAPAYVQQKHVTESPIIGVVAWAPSPGAHGPVFGVAC